jgi:hypothetical protein
MVELFRLQMKTAQMLVEAQTVIALRLMGAAGVLPAAKGENLRMVTEKQEAFATAWMDAATAVMTGKGSQAVYASALAPIGMATRANSRRLMRGAFR